MVATLDRVLRIREAPMPANHSMGDFSQDAQLVLAARGGDRAAFGELYERFARMVHGVLLAHVPYTEVEDLLQDVFLIALRRLDSCASQWRLPVGCWRSREIEQTIFIAGRAQAKKFRNHPAALIPTSTKPERHWRRSNLCRRRIARR